MKASRHLIAGTVAAREDPGQPVIWELANVYLWDLAIVSWAYDWATRNGAGQSLNFWRTAIKEGFAAGDWNGTNSARGAINSSIAGAEPRIHAVGYALASEVFSTFPAQFVGRSVNANDVLVRFTFYGDADLNGTVNFDDYVRTDNGFNNHLTGWSNGDYNFNDQVNFDDYVLIDLAFNTQAATH